MIQSQQLVNNHPQSVDHVTPAPPPAQLSTAHMPRAMGQRDEGVASGRQELRGGEGTQDPRTVVATTSKCAMGLWGRAGRLLGGESTVEGRNSLA